VLLVDDDEDIRLYLRVVLEAEGFEVAEAGAGREALEAGATWDPDVIVGRAEDAVRLRTLQRGADDFLAKPFSSRELVERIHAILRPGPRPTARAAPGA
jgi:two-component system KDP operon response regulator KdpE